MDSASPDGIAGHVIVCGLQGVGLRTVEQFHLSGTPVVVVDDDTDPRFARILAGLGRPARPPPRPSRRGLRRRRASTRAAAVVCVEVDEIHTLETALRIRELRPDVPPGRAAGQPVGRPGARAGVGPGQRARRRLPGRTVLRRGVPAPALARNRAGRRRVRRGPARVEGREHAHDTFRSHFGNLAPVAIMPVDGCAHGGVPGTGPPAVARGTGWPCWAPWTSCAARHRPSATGRRPRPVGRALARRIRLQVGIALEEGNRALAVVAVALLALIVLATIVLHFAYRHRGNVGHLGVLSSLYFTVETVATVGLRGLQLRPSERLADRVRHRS